MFAHVNLIHVSFIKGSEKVPMGRLALKNRKIYFEYAAEFLKLGFQLSPFKLPLRSGLIECKDYLFDGLFGVFNDSLPDGWGRLLLDRRLLQLGINPGELTALDRLCYVGHSGLGALLYEPELGCTTHLPNDDLDVIADECHQFQVGDDDRFVEDLLVLNGSSAGARPKILISLNNDKIHFTDQPLGAVHNDWIIKFSSSLDLYDMGPIEYAYHLMAVQAGLIVPEARLFESKKCAGYFGVKRFDRVGTSFLHMHSVSGLLHADHRMPSLDYEAIMKACLWLTRDVRECETLFRNSVFNVLTHNRDDHAKNFSFLMDEKGVWHVSPAYDLIFSSGPAGEHCTTVMGEGKMPQGAHLIKLAEVAGIKKAKALEIMDEVQQAVRKWAAFAKSANVSQKSTAMIQKSLDFVNKNFAWGNV